MGFGLFEQEQEVDGPLKLCIRILEDGLPAARSGRVFEGDLIESVNGVELAGMSYHVATGMLRYAISAGRPVRLVLIHPFASYERWQLEDGVEGRAPSDDEDL